MSPQLEELSVHIEPSTINIISPCPLENEKKKEWVVWEAGMSDGRLSAEARE